MSVKQLLEKGPMYPTKEGYYMMETVEDPLLVDLFCKLKKNHRDVFKVPVAARMGYGLVNLDMIRYIMGESPRLFGPGKFKENYFKPFMAKNVGINHWPEWQIHRPFVERVLGKGMRNDANELVAAKLEQYIFEFSNNVLVCADDFIQLGTTAATGINFGERHRNPRYGDPMVNMFIESQSNIMSIFGKDPVSEETRGEYKRVMEHILNDPPEDSLMYRAKVAATGREAIIDQVPHWFFPVRNILGITLPTSLIVLETFPEVKARIQEEIDSGANIYREDTYLHFTVLEIFRMYGIVTTMMRTANGKVSIPACGFQKPECEKEMTKGKLSCPAHKCEPVYNFCKGDQLMITASMLTRNEECFPATNKFNPERWTPAYMRKEHGKCDVVFSTGTQRCAGKHMGIVVLKKAIHDLMKTTEIEVIEPAINRDNMPHFINSFRVKVSLRRKKINFKNSFVV